VKSGKERRAKSEGEKVGRHPEASYPGRRTCKAFQTHPAARLLETGRFLLFYSVPIVSGVRRRWRDRQVQSNSKCSSMRVQNAKPGGVDELRVCRVGAIHVTWANASHGPQNPFTRACSSHPAESSTCLSRISPLLNSASNSTACSLLQTSCTASI